MVGIIVACVFWALSLAGLYFAMKNDIDKATALAIEVKAKVDRYNLELLNYRIDKLDKKMDDLDDKATNIIDIINDSRRSGR